MFIAADLFIVNLQFKTLPILKVLKVECPDEVRRRFYAVGSGIYLEYEIWNLELLLRFHPDRKSQIPGLPVDGNNGGSRRQP